MKDFICCICGAKCTGWGNNPDGAGWTDLEGNIEFPEFKSGDLCCDECNKRYVIPGRMYLTYHHKKETESK